MNDWAAFSSEESNNTENMAMVHSVSAPSGYIDSSNWPPGDHSRNLHSNESTPMNNETIFDPIQTVPRPTFHLKTNDNTVLLPFC